MAITGKARRAISYRAGFWLAVLLVPLSCGGKAQGSGHSSAGAADGGGGGDASGGSGDVATCPQAEPEEGDSCASAGAVCVGFGSLSCPDIASCTASGEWRITCPAMPIGYPNVPACPCAHPVTDDGGL